MPLPPIEAEPLPEVRIFPLPLADTRSPLSTVTPRWDRPSGTHGVASHGVDATIAADFPLISLGHPLGDRYVEYQFGITSAAFLGFTNDGALTFGLQTFDGLFAFPLDIHVNRLAARLQWAHISAHFGDGARYLGLRPWTTPGWSREFVQLQVGYQLGPARPYAGIRWITHGTGDDTPLGLQIGLDAIGPWRLSPCGAADLQIAADTAWDPAVALQLGACATGDRSRARAALFWRSGPDDTGKLQHLSPEDGGGEERFIGLQFGFDQTTGLLRWDP